MSDKKVTKNTFVQIQPYFVKNIRAIGWRQYNDTFLCVNAIHLHQHLIQCMLLLTISCPVAASNKKTTKIYVRSILVVVTYMQIHKYAFSN